MSDTKEPRIGIDLEGPRVTMRTLLEAGAKLLRILEAVDKELLKRPRLSLDWVVTEMAAGSARIMARPSPLQRDVPLWAGREVVQVTAKGFDSIRRGRPRPKDFPERAVTEVHGLVQLLERAGIHGIAIRTTDLTIPLPRTIASEGIAEGEIAIGSVEGRLETASVHGQNYFNVYDELTGNAVRCYFPPGLLDDVRAGLARRVVVSGNLFLNPDGERESMKVEELTIFPEPHELPTLTEIAGTLFND